MTNKEAAQPELSDVAVSAMAVEEMLKDLLPKRGMWEIEGDEAKTAICEVIRDALEGLWKLPFVKTNSKESSLTQKELDTISRHTAIEKLKRRKKIFCENRVEFWLLPENDKSRVDEIDACIEMLMNLPSAQPDVPDTNVGEWDMFELITSTWYGKQCYFVEENGIVYSRVSHKRMSVDEAIKEFLWRIGDNG